MKVLALGALAVFVAFAGHPGHRPAAHPHHPIVRRILPSVVVRPTERPVQTPIRVILPANP
jgi:hypothetical protein